MVITPLQLLQISGFQVNSLINSARDRPYISPPFRTPQSKGSCKEPLLLDAQILVACDLEGRHYPYRADAFIAVRATSNGANHGYPPHGTVHKMRAIEITLPEAIVDLHSRFRVDHVIRAQLVGLGLPFNGFGFFSWNDEEQFFVQLSRMIDYGNDGVRRILRKTENGKDLDEAIDMVVGYWGCGEVEVPHIESVRECRLDSLSSVSMTARFVRGANATFYRNHHDLEVDLVFVMGLLLDNKEVTIESADARLLDFWYWVNRLLPRRV